jgi:hypothetical protein
LEAADKGNAHVVAPASKLVPEPHEIVRRLFNEGEIINVVLQAVRRFP